MEILGILLAVLGLLFAFEAPRKLFLRSIGLGAKSPRTTGTEAAYHAPDQPITNASIILYLSASPASLELDNQIAADAGVSPGPLSGDGQWLVDEAKELGVSTIRELDVLLRRNSRHARLLAHAFQRSRTISFGDGVALALEIEAMERFGSDWYDKYLSKLRLTSTGRGYAADLLDFYKTVKQANA